MKQAFLFIVVLLIIQNLSGQSTIVSTSDGNWSNSATWAGGVVPGANDTVEIKHQVTIDADESCSRFVVKTGGELILNSAYTFSTTVNDNVYENRIDSSGVFTMSTGTFNSKIDFTVYGTLNISGGTFNVGTEKFDILNINGNEHDNVATLNFSGGTINVGGRYMTVKGGSAYLSGNAQLNICTVANQDNDYFNMLVRGTGEFNVAAGSNVQIVIKNGNMGNGYTVYYSPATSNFDGGSLKIEETENFNLLAKIDMPLYKLELDVADTVRFVNDYDKYDTINYLVINSGILRLDTTSFLAVKDGITGATSSNFIIGSGKLHDGTINNASFMYLGAGSVSAKVERFINAWSDSYHGWHFISSPVTNQAISPEFVDISASPISSDVDFYRWGETEDLWINIKNSSGGYNQGSGSGYFSNDASPVFENGSGYLIAYHSDNLKEFNGTLITGDVTISGLTNTAGNTYAGWHLLGNPYTSALYWNKTAWGLSDIDGTAKIWDESNGSYTDISSGSGIIPSMQGFMVHVSTPGSSSGSLTIDASDRTHNEHKWYKSDSIITNRIKLTVYDDEGKTAQESIVTIDPQSTTGFDIQYDSHFLPGYAPQFYSLSADGVAVSTNTIPGVDKYNSIPFVFVKNGSSDFYIKAEGVNTLIPYVDVYLNDVKTGNRQKLNDNPIYYFTSVQDDDPNRFELVFGTSGIENNSIDTDNINIFTRKNSIEIRSKNPLTAEVNIYNMIGQKVANTFVKEQQTISIDTKTLKGTVVVSVVTGNRVINKKVIIK